MREFTGWYRDRLGEENCFFELTGSELSTIIRGVRFSTMMPEDWEASPDAPANGLEMFAFRNDVLNNCEIGFEVPVHAFGCTDAVLRLNFDLREPESLSAELYVGEKTWSATVNETILPMVLAALQRILPPEADLEICFSCRWGMEDPFHRINGNHSCYRDHRDARTGATTILAQRRLAVLMLHEVRQEFDACEEFAPRGDGWFEAVVTNGH